MKIFEKKLKDKFTAGIICRAICINFVLCQNYMIHQSAKNAWYWWD